jgi:hypothetical protein
MLQNAMEKGYKTILEIVYFGFGPGLQSPLISKLPVKDIIKLEVSACRITSFMFKINREQTLLGSDEQYIAWPSLWQEFPVQLLVAFE